MLFTVVIQHGRQIMRSKFRPHLCSRLAMGSQHWRDYSIKIGDTHSLTKTYTPEDVKGFADITLDHNPLHLDAQYAQTTRFGKPIVHGLLSLGSVYWGQFIVLLISHLWTLFMHIIISYIKGNIIPNVLFFFQTCRWNIWYALPWAWVSSGVIWKH